MAASLTSRERVKMTINHEIPDRVPKQDEPWHATVARWRTEGFPADADPADYFDYDLRTIGADLTPRMPIRTLSEDEEYITETTPQGGIRRNHKDHSTTPEVIDSPVKCKDDWPRIKKLLEPDATRVNWDALRADYKRWREAGRYIVFGGASGYDWAQQYISSEELLIFMAEDPEWIGEMIMTIAELITATLKMLAEKGFEFDALYTYNDMGYKNASLFSPRMYRDMVQPGDKLLWDTAHALGLQTILHSCGRVSALVPDMLDAGLDCLQVLQISAGMNPGQLKRDFGDRLALFGGIDTRRLEHPDPAEIEDEIRTRFAECMAGGGYLYHTDHSVPKDVSLEQYRHCLALVEKYGRYD